VPYDYGLYNLRQHLAPIHGVTFPHHDRRLDAGRQQSADCVCGRDDLRDRQIEIDVRLKIDLLDRDAGQRLRLDVLDAVDIGAARSP
jgi:hypothetical protein